MGADVNRSCYFSVLRWRKDTTRDEGRNVAVVLVDEIGREGGVKAAPLSRISPNLKEQGILDSILDGLRQQFQLEQKPNLETLRNWHAELHDAIYLTEPQIAIVTDDAQATLDSLYRAYAAQQGGGGSRVTKGALLDTTMEKVRKFGYSARRGEYIDDFLFDMTVDTKMDRLFAVQVLSFKNPKKAWVTEELGAGHFLYALKTLDALGAAVIQPPVDISLPTAVETYDRVRRWFDKEGVPYANSDELREAEAFAELVSAAATRHG